MTGQIFTACVLVVIFRSISVFADGPPVSCCFRLGDRRPHLDKILNYRIQTKEMCPIRAVLFQTVAGKTLCSKPESSWTKSAMWKVDEDQRKLRAGS
ncbi:monocyte chemotactic protein 1B-like [Danio aesculapii]|uniref:monocyte chemotactic protein 1B-like n=1 Tax=Danio aesculapii TaxID=1142201 RepID=UPI0024BF6648|nr:monocyte chemotactic protein 1B-like [Danio aesculapii]